MPALTLVSNHLLLRYTSGGSFSFRHVNIDSTDQSMYKLGTAIGSIQDEQPKKICTVAKHHIYIA